jgi:hypothetical protein
MVSVHRLVASMEVEGMEHLECHHARPVKMSVEGVVEREHQ